MQLIIGEELIEVDNTDEGIEQLFDTIEEKAANTQLVFSHLIIDGVEVYDDFAAYLHNNLANIQVVEVQFISLKEYMQDILVSASEYLQRAIPAVEQLAESIYAEMDTNTWQQISQLIEGIQWLHDSFTAMDKLPNLSNLVNDYEQWNLYSQALNELVEVVTTISEPLQYTDQVSVSDIILYEIKPAMEKLYSNLLLLI
ncbi:MAG: hypothetical protein GXX02_02525 [Syntrophomonadaceae bacterium]|nr:hypothetical protein [Syntrophomonadaceae bacterium]